MKNVKLKIKNEQAGRGAVGASDHHPWPVIAYIPVFSGVFVCPTEGWAGEAG
jgi:hypothetical protein